MYFYSFSMSNQKWLKHLPEIRVIWLILLGHEEEQHPVKHLDTPKGADAHVQEHTVQHRHRDHAQHPKINVCKIGTFFIIRMDTNDRGSENQYIYYLTLRHSTRHNDTRTDRVIEDLRS